MLINLSQSHLRVLLHLLSPPHHILIFDLALRAILDDGVVESGLVRVPSGSVLDQVDVRALEIMAAVDFNVSLLLMLDLSL